MNAEAQAEKLIDEAYQYAPSSGYLQEKFAIEIAIWCANKIGSNVGFSDNDEYWVEVITYLKKQLNNI